MKTKAEMSEYMYLALIVMVGIIGVTFIIMQLSPVDSPEARSLELASSLGLYLDSMSTMEQGTVTLDFNGNRYDIDIGKYDSSLRTIGRFLLPDDWILERGFHIAVTPKLEAGNGGKEEKAESAFFKISTFGLKESCSELNLDADCSKQFRNVDKICVVKEPEKRYAEVKEC